MEREVCYRDRSKLFFDGLSTNPFFESCPSCYLKHRRQHPSEVRPNILDDIARGRAKESPCKGRLGTDEIWRRYRKNSYNPGEYSREPCHPFRRSNPISASRFHSSFRLVRETA